MPRLNANRVHLSGVCLHTCVVGGAVDVGVGADADVPMD